MTKRIILAGILGGILMFVWSSVAHMMTSLPAMGIQEIPNEQPVLAAMQAQIGQAHGFYIFPGFGLGPNATAAQRRAAMGSYQQKLDASPSGMLIYRPAGARAMTGGQLGTEFLTELAEALLVVFLLSRARLASYASRVGFVIVTGVLAAITTNISYWNWYGFPGNYTFGYMLTEIIGFVLLGLLAAAIVKTCANQAVAATV